MIRKLFVCVIFVFLGFFTLSLPDPYLSDVEELATEQAYEGFPDADLRSIAEQEWEAGRKETALSILDYIIEENMGDAAGARVLKQQYVRRIEEDESVVGRFQAAAYGFATGNVEDMSGLVGSSLADFLIYGDIRDLVREFVFEDDTDEIVVALSAAGIITTIYPPAEGAVTATKALKKASVFSARHDRSSQEEAQGFQRSQYNGQGIQSQGQLSALLRSCSAIEIVGGIYHNGKALPKSGPGEASCQTRFPCPRKRKKSRANSRSGWK